MGLAPGQPVSAVTPRTCGVLVADDDAAIRDAVQFGLQQKGFSVWLAPDGAAALELYRAHCETIQVALLDVRMPRLDGPATLAALQELTPQIPCCFMSGYLGTYTEEGLYRCGARAILMKPFRLTDMVRLIREVLDGVDRRPVRPLSVDVEPQAPRCRMVPPAGLLP